MSGWRERLAAGASAILERPLTAGEAVLFEKYLAILIKWQRAQRLLGSAEPDWIVDNVFLDSLLFLEWLPPGAERIIDIGSGAGVPGIPIKIARSGADVFLLESRMRRVSFLRAAARELAIPGLHVLSGRLEELSTTLPEHFEAAVMRCAGSPESLIDSIYPMLRPGGLVVVSAPPVEGLVPGAKRVSVEGTKGPRHFALFRKP